jgi:hypothetical protein
MIFSFYAGALMPRDAPDMNGVSHAVEITAAAFYEAVAPCLAATNRLPESPRGSNAVKVPVADVRVEHEVKTMDFTKWFEETDGSPREVSDCLNLINSRPPLLYPATTMKLNRADLIAGERRFVLSAFRCGNAKDLPELGFHSRR